MLRLHDYVLSPESYSVRLMLALLGLTYETIAVDAYPGTGEVPVLEDGETILRDPGLILTWIARSHAPDWLPADAAPVISHWLSFAALDLSALNKARAIATLNAPGDFAAMRTKGRAALRTVEDTLTRNNLTGLDWIAAPRPTIADIAIFPAVMLSHDSGLGQEDYPAINLWHRRLRHLPGFIGMPGIPDYF